MDINREKPQIEQIQELARPGLSHRRLVSTGQIIAIAFIITMVAAGLMLPRLSTKIQYVLILIVPASIMGISILMNPFIGVCCFFIYEYTRPDGFIPALVPMKIAILIEVMTLSSWFFYYVRKNRRFNWHYFNIVFLIFLFVMGLTTITAMNNRFAYDMFQLILVNFVIFLIATNVIDSFKRLNVLIWLLLIIDTFFAFKGIQTNGKVGGSLMGDENDLALALNVMIPFAYFIFIESPTRLKGLISLGMLNVLTLGVVSSLSRGGWVGLIAVFAFCFIRSKRKLMSLAVAAILTLAVVKFAPPQYWAEIKSITNSQESTAQSRIHYWEAAWRMFEANPLIGVGAGNGPVRMPEFVKDMGDVGRQWGRTFHGTIPQVMGELGGIGLSSYLLMVLLAFIFLFKILKRDHGEHDGEAKVFANSIMGALIGYMATAIFLSTAYYPHLWTMFTLTMILFYLTRDISLQGAASIPEEAAQPSESFGKVV